MREIMFKARQAHGDKAGMWWFGPVHQDPVDGTVQIYTGTIGWVQVDPETVGQFTGLKDKTGMNAYEGDRIRIHRPSRDSQTHYGEHIPGPTNTYTEPLEPIIKTTEHVIVFVDGTFTLANEKGEPNEVTDGWITPMSWDVKSYSLNNVQALIDDFGGQDDIWESTDESGDLDYLLETYPPSSLEELIAYVSGFEVIGNTHDSPPSHG